MYEKEGVAIIKSLYKKIQHEFAGIKDFGLCGEGWWKFYISVKIIEYANCKYCPLHLNSIIFQLYFGQILVHEKNVNKSACNKLFLCKKVTMRLNKLIKTFT